MRGVLIFCAFLIGLSMNLALWVIAGHVRTIAYQQTLQTCAMMAEHGALCSAARSAP